MRCSMVPTTLENLEITGNLLILENLGNLKFTHGISDAVFFVTQSEAHNKTTCKFAWLQWYLCELLVVVCRILVVVLI